MSSLREKKHVYFENVVIISAASRYQVKSVNSLAAQLFINMKPSREVIVTTPRGMGKKTLFVI